MANRNNEKAYTFGVGNDYADIIDDDDGLDGWTITWTSKENCTTNPSQPYKVQIIGDCVVANQTTSQMTKGLFTPLTS